ncbi:MAG: single-stranded-DNA-specific exonuclease RecJ [Candidatus Dormibacteria bacterium]
MTVPDGALAGAPRAPRRVRREWQMDESEPPGSFRPELQGLVRRVAWARRATIGEELDAFLDPGLERLHDPFAIKGLPEAAAMVAETITSGGKVAIFGDYDADGVTAAAILCLGLGALGAETMAYIPHRVNDGYGLNLEGLADLHRQGAAVVVSCDCGTNSVDVVAARPAGQRLVVTDHHLPAAQIAQPDALLNPHQAGDTYPFKDLSGAGVAYKLLLGVAALPGMVERANPEFMERLLQLVAIGAVADVVPLHGENRALVRRGIGSLNADPLPGVAALLETGNIRLPMDTRTLGFQLAPRINAAGRMADARLALDLLMAEDRETALPLAQHLEGHNAARRAATEQAMREAEERITDLGGDPPAIVLADERWSLGLVGLVAGRLADAHHCPAFIMNRGPVESRGSARTVHGFHVVEALDACATYLARYGGHAAAGGFSLANSELDGFTQAMLEYAGRERPDEGWSRLIPVDAEICMNEITPETVRGLSVLEPHGEGNPPPRFACRGATIKAATAFGADRSHLKLFLGQNGSVVEAVAWNRGVYLDAYQRAWRSGRPVDVLFSAAVHEWNGQVSVRLELEDLKPST